MLVDGVGLPGSSCCCHRRFPVLDPQFNYIDFIVVVLGYVELLPGVARLSWVRAVRVLRPLKVLSKLKGLRVIVLTLFNSVGHLSQASILVLFLFTVYSIICVQVGFARRGSCWRRREVGDGCVLSGVPFRVVGVADTHTASVFRTRVVAANGD